MRAKRLQLLVAAFIIIILVPLGCKREPKIPLDKIDIQVKVHRFDQDLFSINTDKIDMEIPKLAQKYGNFFNLFTEGIIRIGKFDEPDFASYFMSFTTDNMVSKTYKDVQRVFPSTSKLDIELTNAFKRYRYYFPNSQIPQVYGFVSGFNNSIVIGDSILGVGFDRYLGRDTEYYSRLGIAKYLQYNMHPAKIPSDLLRAWAFSEFQFNDSIDNLVNNMIYEGALMYLTQKVLPNQPDSLIFGFNPSQMKWCKQNESEMWAYLVEHKLLFNTDNFTINQFVGNAPFTKGFPSESPGKAAVWLGYRIVSRFMDRNKDYSLEKLLLETDYQSILTRARYNP